MNPERWAQIKPIFHEAAEQPVAERSAFIKSRCGDDESLALEIESLLSAHDRAGDFIEAFPTDETIVTLGDLPLEPMTGRQIGPYKIINLIGRGGMGEIYLAQDSRLGRRVALKLLPSHLTQDKQRLERFKQEARAASALNHPNILTIYEIGEAEGRPFIATEFVEGETLRARIDTSGMGPGETIDLAVQVASGLNAAHEAGIVHRDIKPENIMLRRDGYGKILDFGLAKLIEQRATGQGVSALVKTEEGMIMGTARYMSPEQARGQSVDARADIWSLGVVLYEMLAGRVPFEGETPGDVIVSILEREPPPLARYVEDVPAEFDSIARKALRKAREERYQTATELLSDLKGVKQRLEFEAELERSAQTDSKARASVQTAKRSPTQTGEVKTTRTSSVEYIITELKRHQRRAVSISGLIVLAVAWYLGGRFRPATEEARTPPKNAAFTQLTDQAGEEHFSSLSPDGKSFVYASYASGNSDVYLQRVGGRNPINLTKDSLSDDTQPAFSPDGEHIAFRSEREGGGIFVMGATGESVKRLTDFGFNPAWSPDGKEIACDDDNLFDPNLQLNPGSRIRAVNVATGEERPVTKVHSRQPNWSPRGVRIAYFGVRLPGGQRDIWTIPAAGGEPVEVTNDQALDWNPVWSPDGKYLYFASDRGGSMNLWRIPVEENSGKVLGQPEAVTTPSPYSGHVSFSHDGKRMIYTQTVNRVNLQQVGFDPGRETVTGQPAPITQGSMWAGAPNLSPDGEWLAFDSQGGQQEDLFVIRRDGTSLRQLTNDMNRDRMPRWSPDGRRLAFFSDRSGNSDAIWLINSDGSGLQQLTYTSQSATMPVWSPDGTRLAYLNKGGTASIIEVGKSWHEQSPEALPAMSDSGDWFPESWSPDGRKLAGWGVRVGVSVYSLESRQYESLTDFGWGATWLSDSRRILFQARGKLYMVDSQSKKVREVLSVAPHGIGRVTVSREDRLICFSAVTTEADIWMMTLE